MIMAANINKLAELAIPRSETAIENARFRRENRDWLRMSEEIALNVHYYLRTTNTTQKQLADKMGVSAVYIGKLLRGKENLTLETICKVQKAIGIDFVSISHPYYSSLIEISLSSNRRFSEENAVKSESYGNVVPSGDYFTLVEDNVA